METLMDTVVAGFLTAIDGALRNVAPFGLGLGVAILVEKTSEGPLALPAGKSAGIRIGSVELSFTGKTRNEDVKV